MTLPSQKYAFTKNSLLDDISNNQSISLQRRVTLNANFLLKKSFNYLILDCNQIFSLMSHEFFSDNQ
jgi:hypothetical protein